MNIGLTCNSFALAGGMERYAITLVDGLGELGYRTTVFARSFAPALMAGRDVKPVRVRVGWVPRRWRDRWFARRVAALRRASGVDVLVDCTRTDGADLAICGGLHIGFLRAMGKAPAGFDQARIDDERRYYGRVKSIMVHSRGLAREMADDYGIDPGKIHVVYPPTSGKVFTPVSTAERLKLRASLGWPDDKVVFVFPSFSHQRKGLPLLEQVFTRSRLPVLLAVTGRPVPAGLDNIGFYGARDDMETLYRAADYAILASHYEPFGLVGTEAVLCGTPAVMPDSIGVSEVLSDKARIGFRIDDAATLAAAVETAVRRTLDGKGRIDDPRAEIAFDPDPAAHAKALLGLLGLA